MAVTDTLGVSLNYVISWVRRTTLADGTNISDASNHTYSRSLGYGTTADNADRLWHDQRTIGPGANDDIDLTNLAQQVFTGSLPVAMVNVKAINIICLSTTTGDKLKIDTSVANGYQSVTDGASGRIPIGPDSPTVLANKKDGMGAVTSTNRILRITNPGATAVSYKIVVVGTSA